MAFSTGSNDNPWQALWTNWSRFAQGATSSAWPFGNVEGKAGNDMLGLLAQTYAEFGRSILAMVSSAAPGGMAEALAGRFEAWARAQGGSAAQASMRDFLGAAPAQLAAAMAQMGESSLHQRAINTLLAWTNEVLALPAIGPQRDWQAALQVLARALVTEQQAVGVVNQHYQEAFRRGCARFARYLRDTTGPPITTLAALYDAWIDQAELGYAEVVRSAAFAADFAAWVNAGSAVRAAAAGLRERIADSLDLPQRTEINALLEGQHALRAEVTRLQEALARVPAASSEVELPRPRSQARKNPPVLKARVQPSKPAAAQRIARATKAKPKPRGRAPEFDISNILTGQD